MAGGGPPAGPSSASTSGTAGGGPADRRGPKPCYEYHQRGFCHKGPACTFDHNPAYQGYIPPPIEVAQQLAMAGMGDRVDYGSIWQGRGPMQFGGMGMGGFPMGPGMGGPPFGGPGFAPPNGGRPGGPPFNGQQMPPPGWQQQQGGGPGFRPPQGGMQNGPPMMMGSSMGAPRSHASMGGPGGGRGGQRGGAFPTDASTQPPKNRNGKTLVIMQIPPASLAVPAVTDYFTKFGTVTSVALDVPSARALVSFATNEEAYKAWKSEDAVFGSRFVKVLWHRPMEGQGAKGLEALEKGKAALAAADGSGNKDAAMTDNSTPPAPVLSKAEMLAKQRLLESQIAQQKVLMARLSGPDLPTEEKAKLMAQFSKLSDEMKAGTGSLALAKPSTATATNTAGNRTATFNQPAADESPAAADSGSMDGVEGTAAEPVAELSQTEMLQRKLEVLKAEVRRLLAVRDQGCQSLTLFPFGSAGRADRCRSQRALITGTVDPLQPSATWQGSRSRPGCGPGRLPRRLQLHLRAGSGRAERAQEHDARLPDKEHRRRGRGPDRRPRGGRRGRAVVRGALFLQARTLWLRDHRLMLACDLVADDRRCRQLKGRELGQPDHRHLQIAAARREGAGRPRFRSPSGSPR
jgi:RNA-binding protein 26